MKESRRVFYEIFPKFIYEFSSVKSFVWFIIGQIFGGILTLGLIIWFFWPD